MPAIPPNPGPPSDAHLCGLRTLTVRLSAQAEVEPAPSPRHRFQPRSTPVLSGNGFDEVQSKSPTFVLSVTVDCSKFQPAQQPGTATNVPPPSETQGGATVDSCKVAYATLRAEGCTIRPLVIAVAVLPESCDAHEASCVCGCCH